MVATVGAGDRSWRDTSRRDGGPTTRSARKVAEWLAAAPDATVNVHSRTNEWHGTYADIDDEARRLIALLRAEGIEPGAVVAFQLPNWREAVVVVRRAGDGWLRARADRAHLRPQGGRVHPRPSAAPTRTSRPPRTATSTTPPSSTRPRPTACALHVVVGDGADRPRAGRHPPRRLGLASASFEPVDRPADRRPPTRSRCSPTRRAPPATRRV